MSRLTARAIESFKPGSQRREIPDPHIPGLYFVVQPSGAKSWAVRYRHRGTPRKYTIGKYPVFDLATARVAAAKALRTVAEGRDPGREKIEERAAKPDSVERIAEQFIARHSARNKSARQTERLFRLYVLPHWRARLIQEITKRDVLDLLDRVIDGGKPIQANRVFAAIRKLFNWAIARDILAASPCNGLKRPAPERSRDRVLSDPELRAVWGAADRIGYPFGSLVKLLILTGQRRDECAGMRWSELDLKSHIWTLPPDRVKNNRPHDVPLSSAAVALIEQLPRIAGDFVMTTNGATASSGYGKGKRRLDALLPSDMPAWRLHDTRRTVASGMARLGINLPVIEKVLNHASGSFAGIVAVYQKHEFADQKRHALERWGDFVGDLVADRPRKNVVALRKGRDRA